MLNRRNMIIPWSSRSHGFTFKEIRTIIKVSNSADPLTQGKYLKRFEEKFEKFLKTKGKAFGVTSGASAIELVATLLNLKKNDEVIIPAHTYCASALPVCRYKAKIKWVDINLDDFTIDINHLRKLITKKTKAIMAVHLYGKPCDIIAIKKICSEKKIFLIEDCAQALGAKVQNQIVGTFGDFSIFSFHAQKAITTLGEGGMLVVNNRKFTNKVNGLRHNGHAPFKNKKKYWKPAMIDVREDIKGIVPFNFPMTEVQAALGTELLKRINFLNKIRIRRALKFISACKKFNFLKFQKVNKNVCNVYHLLPAFIDTKINKINKDRFLEIMSSKYKIQVIVQYYPLYKYHFFKKQKNIDNKKLKNTEFFFKNMVSFPFHVWMSNEKFQYLINSTLKTLETLEKKK